MNTYWIKTTVKSCQNLGPIFTFKFLLLFSIAKKTLTINVPGYFQPITIRKNGTDFRVFCEIVILEAYKHATVPEAKAIIDAGANIGLSTVYFANRYPRAQITAIEVDVDNYNLLAKNISVYPNVTAINKALWYRSTNIQISNPDGKKTAIRVESLPDNETAGIPTITIPELLESNHNCIDLFKVDIEGAERHVFKELSLEELNSIKLLVIELHDFKIDGCAHSFYSHITKARFKQKQWGENLYITFH